MSLHDHASMKRHAEKGEREKLHRLAEGGVAEHKTEKHLVDGEIKKAKGKSVSGEDRKVTTEARRLGREVIKDMIKAAKGRIGDYSAKQITEAADELIKGDPSFVVKAKENLASRNDTLPVLDIGALIQPDAKKVAKRKADEASKPLSAKQAGMTGKVPPRRKPQEVHTQH